MSDEQTRRDELWLALSAALPSGEAREHLRSAVMNDGSAALLFRCGLTIDDRNVALATIAAVALVHIATLNVHLVKMANLQPPPSIIINTPCPSCKQGILMDMGSGTIGLRCTKCRYATAGGQG